MARLLLGSGAILTMFKACIYQFPPPKHSISFENRIVLFEGMRLFKCHGRRHDLRQLLLV
jgi:hypothetical protein